MPSIIHMLKLVGSTMDFNHRTCRRCHTFGPCHFPLPFPSRCLLCSPFISFFQFRQFQAFAHRWHPASCTGHRCNTGGAIHRPFIRFSDPHDTASHWRCSLGFDCEGAAPKRQEYAVRPLASLHPKVAVSGTDSERVGVWTRFFDVNSWWMPTVKAWRMAKERIRNSRRTKNR